jgi:phosphatidylserine/phosphatidylglycerophosphate/cardiolipin synthase-like enzyme
MPPRSTRPRPRAADWAAGTALLAAIVELSAAVLAAGAAPAAKTVPPAPIQLVESVPVESGLGNPGLPAAADVWVEMIDGARRSLDLEHFYLSHWPGEPTGPVLDAIGRAAKRGVHVRLLLDARMYATYPSPADSLGRLAGVELRQIDMKKISGGGVQHGKWMIVDGEQVFVGSQNLDWRALKHIHELGVRARDRHIADLFLRVFESDWRASAPQATASVSTGASAGPSAAGPIPPLPIRLVQAAGDTVEVWPSFSPRGHIPDPSLWDLDAIVPRIDAARGEIVVQLLTYGLGRAAERDSTIDEALRRAAGRGVSVKLLVSDWEADNGRIADLQRLSQVANLEAKLSTVPEWSGGYIPFARVEHCKYMVVDTLWTWVGTSNWEPDYFHSSRNAALTMRNRLIARQARAIFETSWRSPTSQVVHADRAYAPKTHRETPPPGRSTYGR